ncbi:hypothetical protein [Gimesia algae]|uniref:Uncharacterized protein n=1 Tax=Gimesia algae TaxID=2527971 RepID=A0A517VAN2_9PLAN|nr:hypothetical protein [Gimesia algae]QDT90067.1 hypothetical protein Pan161_17120 [Gimesia algae]
MIFSQSLILSTLMFVLLAVPAIVSSEQKDKPFSIPEIIKKKQVGKWQASKAMLLRSGKQPAVVINAKRTNYELSDGSEKFTISVTAFSDSESGSIWVGREQIGYLEIDNKILGFHVFGEMILWTESILDHDPKSTLPDVTNITNHFEKNVTGGSLQAANNGLTNLKEIDQDSRVFGNGYGSSGGPMPIVTGFQWDRNLLKLSLTEPEKLYEATVWIDVNSREVKKAEEKRSKLGEKLYQEQKAALKAQNEKKENSQ